MNNIASTPGKRALITILQAGVVLVGITALLLMLWEPHLEGRNVNATLFEIYFKDPFLAYVYVSSIPFFIALYQLFKLFGYARVGIIFSPASAQAVRTIKYCALITIGLILGAEAYIVASMGGKDDIAGGVAVGLFLMFLFAMTAITASFFERTLRAKK